MSLFEKFESISRSRQELGNEGPAPLATPFEEIRSPTRGVIEGHEVILAGTNNYLGLTFNSNVVSASQEALGHLGSGTTGSRMANGSYAGHALLEQELAQAFGWPSAMVFSTGYQANLGVMSSIVGADEYLLIDADSHASIYDGCRMSKAQTLTFRHNDPENLDRKLARLGDEAKKTLVVVEGLYSMLGDQPPLQEMVDVKNKHGAWLLVDEAHSFGVFGEHGLGLCEHLGLLDEVDFILGTFSKSLAGIGGFCVSPHAELELLRLASRPYIFTASSSPAVIAGTREALKLLVQGQALRKQLHRNMERLYAGVHRLGFTTGASQPGPVAALILPDKETALRHWQALLSEGVYANLMIPPATPAGLCLLRLSLSAAHTDDDIDAIVEALAIAQARSGQILPQQAQA